MKYVLRGYKKKIKSFDFVLVHTIVHKCKRHVMPDARAVMHVGIANPRWLGKRSRPAFPAHAQPVILRIW